MNLISEINYRASAPTPAFFQGVKRVGLLIAAVGLAVLTAPGEVPNVVMAFATHAVTAGTILVSLAQLTVDEQKLEDRLLQSIG